MPTNYLEYSRHYYQVIILFFNLLSIQRHYFTSILRNKNVHSTCGIQRFVETHICTLCGILVSTRCVSGHRLSLKLQCSLYHTVNSVIRTSASYTSQAPQAQPSHSFNHAAITYKAIHFPPHWRRFQNYNQITSVQSHLRQNSVSFIAHHTSS